MQISHTFVYSKEFELKFYENKYYAKINDFFVLFFNNVHFLSYSVHVVMQLQSQSSSIS